MANERKANLYITGYGQKAIEAAVGKKKFCVVQVGNYISGKEAVDLMKKAILSNRTCSLDGASLIAETSKGASEWDNRYGVIVEGIESFSQLLLEAKQKHKQFTSNLSNFFEVLAKNTTECRLLGKGHIERVGLIYEAYARKALKLGAYGKHVTTAYGSGIVFSSDSVLDACHKSGISFSWISRSI